MTGRRNVAADVAGWSVRHRAIAVIGWVVFVAVAMTLGSLAGQKQMTVDQYAMGDSAKAVKILDDAGLRLGAAEMLLVSRDRPDATSPGVRAVVAELTARGKATGLVAELPDPYTVGLVSADQRSVLVRLSMAGDLTTAGDRVQPIIDAVAATQKAHPQVRIDQFGDGSANKWFNDTIGRDFQRAEWTAVPLALGILLVAFGAFLAAVLPVGLALTAFLAANGVLAVISHRLHVDNATSSVMLLVGLAVGVDYCLFYLRREREERARGNDPATSLRIAAATSGRAVLVSGLTVVVAMSGMFLSGMLLFDGFGIAAILVVLVAVVGSVTVLPALLSLLGDRVDFGRIPGLARMRRPSQGSRTWAAILARVLARPGVSVLAAGAFLLVLAWPAVGIHTERLSLDKLLPADASIMTAYHRITQAFPGGPSPADVVVQAPDVTDSEVTAAVADFQTRALATNLVHEPIQVAVHGPQHVIQISVLQPLDPYASNLTQPPTPAADSACPHVGTYPVTKSIGEVGCADGIAGRTVRSTSGWRSSGTRGRCWSCGTCC